VLGPPGFPLLLCLLAGVPVGAGPVDFFGEGRGSNGAGAAIFCSDGFVYHAAKSRGEAGPYVKMRMIHAC